MKSGRAQFSNVPTTSKADLGEKKANLSDFFSLTSARVTLKTKTVTIPAPETEF